MTNPVNYRLFVYGSLRRGFHNPAYEYISRYFSLVAQAKVKGKLVDMGEYPAAVPTTENIFIIGELYTIKQENEFSWAIGQLDDYEGLNVEEGEIQLYRRELTTAFHNGVSYETWVYWFNGSISDLPEITAGDVLRYLNQKNKP